MPNFDDFRFDDGIFDDVNPISTPTFTGSLVWVCGVYWDGSYSGVSEKMKGYELSRGSAYTIAASGGGLEPLTVGTCTVTLDNIDRRYDPYNTGSPLYPNVAPGKKIFIDVVDVSSGTHYQRFTGEVVNITPDNTGRTVTLDCKDTGNSLEREDITLPIKFSTTTSQAMKDVLAGMGWHHGSNIQTSDNPLTLFTVDEQNSLGVIDMLAQGSLGYVFIGKDGRINYYNRSYSGMLSHSVDQAVVAKDLPVKSPWDTTRKNIVVYANKWARTPIKTIWTCPDLLFLDVGQTKVFSIELPNPSEIIPPVVGLDYPDNMAIISVDTSAGTVVTGAMWTITLSGVTGKGCTISVTNHANAAQWLFSLRLRGREYVQSYSTKQDRGSWRTWVPTIRQDTSTKKKYSYSNSAAGGKFVLDNPYCQDGNFADAYASSISSALATPDQAPILRFDTRAAEAFPIELGDKVVVTSAALGINGTFYALKIEERWTSETGQGYETTIYTGRRILCTASITPEPIPDDGSGGDPIQTIPIDPVGNPTTPGTPPEKYPDACMNAPDAPSTGPFLLQFDKTVVYPGQSAYAMFPCGLRKAGATWGSWLDLMVSTATGNAGNYFQAFAVDSNKTRILTGVKDNSFFDTSIQFTPVTATAIAGFEIFLPLAPLGYTPGNNVYTSQGLEQLFWNHTVPVYPGVHVQFTPPSGVSWPGITDVVGTSIVNNGTSVFEAVCFDLGSEPPADVYLAARCRSSTHDADVRFISSLDGGVWDYISPGWNVSPAPNFGNWVTVSSAGSTHQMHRYLGMAVYVRTCVIDIAYMYLNDVSMPITGQINLGLNNRAWNVCAIPE